MAADVSDLLASERRVPGSRATQWVVSAQPRTTRPAVCRACHSYFAEDEIRLCTRSDRRYGRFLHPDCIPGGLRSNMEFSPDVEQDSLACRSLSDRVRHLVSVGADDTAGMVDGQAALVPSTLDSPLPSARWFEQLDWRAVRQVSGSCFVQIPRRLEEAFSDALGVALREAVCSDDPRRHLAGWKAFLLLHWLLLFRLPALSEGCSCANLLTERLDRFWQGESAAMMREHTLACKSPSSSLGRKTSQTSLVKRVKTLCRSNEVGRALRAADGRHG